MIGPHWQSDCGQAKLWLGDCLRILESMQDGATDAVVTDPPYGIGEAAGKNKSRTCLAVSRDYGNANWDNQINQPAIDQCRRISKQQVIFGGHYYTLPPTSCWLVWDKMKGATDFADCELAWTNLKKAVRQKRHRWQGMLKDGQDQRGLHPTQKPEDVMRWAVQFTKGDIILDPFMGSGTIGVAAIKLGRKFWGIELDDNYFEVAKRRIIEALAFDNFLSGKVSEPEKEPSQQEMFSESHNGS